jgi:phosphate transport system permease protein
MSTMDSKPKVKARIGDIVFSRLAKYSGIGILVTLAAVALFLFIQALPALSPDADFDGKAENLISFVTPYIFGTIYSSLIALVIATPLAVGIALYISHFAPRRFSQIIGYLIDLLAAIPSVVFGLWGILILAPFLNPVYIWLNENLGWIPLFEGQVSATGRTMLTAGIVLAIMILPIMAAIIREVFLQTPRLHEEAALALGATRWEMIKMAVIPFGRPGIISAMMLGLGRALGETMAVALVLSPASIISFALLTSQNSNTIAANIALDFPESGGDFRSLLIATGLILFLITMIVNMTARYIISRRAAFSGAN